MVITDHFTRYALVIALSLQTAKCNAQNLWDKYIIHYGLPQKILIDQGHNFKEDVISELPKLALVKKTIHQSIYLQSNGQYKRFNSTLTGMLGILPEKNMSTWWNHVSTLAHVYIAHLLMPQDSAHINCCLVENQGFLSIYTMVLIQLTLVLILVQNLSNN